MLSSCKSVLSKDPIYQNKRTYGLDDYNTEEIDQVLEKDNRKTKGSKIKLKIKEIREIEDAGRNLMPSVVLTLEKKSPRPDYIVIEACPFSKGGAEEKKCRQTDIQVLNHTIANLLLW